MSEKGTWRDFIAESLPSKYEDEDLIKTVKETIKLKLLTEQAQLKLEIAKTELELMEVSQKLQTAGKAVPASVTAQPVTPKQAVVPPSEQKSYPNPNRHKNKRPFRQQPWKPAPNVPTIEPKLDLREPETLHSMQYVEKVISGANVEHKEVAAKPVESEKKEQDSYAAPLTAKIRGLENLKLPEQPKEATA